MYSRASTLFAVTGLCLAAAAAGCEGSSGGRRGDAGRPSDFEALPPPSTTPNRDAGTGTMIEVRAPVPPPTINAAAVKVWPRGTTPVGGITVGCSYGPATAMSGQQWCAFARPGASLTRPELWVMNMSKLPATCNEANPDPAVCMRLTSTLFSANPMVGPRFPSAHRFFGDTLIFYADATSRAGEEYKGPVYAWQPGWAAPKKISLTSNAFQCVSITRAPVVVCLENLQLEPTISFDLTAGKTDTGAKMIQKIFPAHPATQASQWGASFTADGKYFVFSATAAMEGPENLFYLETDMIGTAQPKMVASGVSAWDIAPDYSKWFYLKDYNYSTTAPSGTLHSNTFPAGGAEVRIASPLIGSGNLEGVADYTLVPTVVPPMSPPGTTASIAFVNVFHKLNAEGKGTVSQIKNLAGDLASPTNVVTVAEGVLGNPFNSLDNRFGMLVTTASTTVEGLGDRRMVRYDTLAKCSLAMQPTSALFGFPFLENAGLTFWVDNYNRDTDAGEGYVADPADCTTKRRQYAKALDYSFPYRDAQLTYTDDVRDETSTLRVAKVMNGELGPGEVIQNQIERISWRLLANHSAALFQIVSTSEQADGIYYIPLTATVRTDGGAEAGTGTPDAGTDAAPADAGAGN